MDDDIKKPLIKKQPNFDRLYEECQIMLQRIKQKNDFMQKQLGYDVEEEIKVQVRKQKQFLLKEIKSIKESMGEMNNLFKDPQHKTKLKMLKNDLQKQIDRNRAIINDLIAKSFIRSSGGDPHEQQDINSFVEGGIIDYKHLQHPNGNGHYQKQSIITDENLDQPRQRQLQIDYEVERKILKEKDQIITEVEQNTVRINDIMNDMAVMLNEQGQNIDIIEKNVDDTHKNMVATNDNLDQANELQKKARKKYIFFVIIIAVVIAIIVGIVLFLNR